MNYTIYYEAKRNGKKIAGNRSVKAPNPGTAENRLIRKLEREGKTTIIIIGVVKADR